jgi:hypothetical protein
MTQSDALPPPGYDTADDPRWVMVADLVGRLAAAVAAGARSYETAASRAEGDLRRGLEEIARAKHAEAADLAPLARALGVSAPVQPLSPPPLGGPPSWGETLGTAFQTERVLEGIARELAGLTPEPAVRALATRLVAAVSRDREEVRKLYLRYT